MKKLIHSTTALGLVLSLSMPAPVIAQTADTVCAQKSADRQFPCQLKNGAVMQSELDVLNARLARNEEALKAALSQQELARRDEVEDNKDTLAAEQVAKAQATIEKTLGYIAQEQAKPAAVATETKPVVQEEAATQTQPVIQEQKASKTKKEKKEKKQNKEKKELTEEQKQARAERQAIRKEERRAARKAAAAAAATEQGANAKVQSETLTQDDVRSSDQEFDTAVTGHNAKEDDGGGLSKFEKALLLGLGAVAVGKVLSNGDEVVSRSGDRVVVKRDGELRVLKDDDALLRQPGNEIQTENFDDGSTRTTVVKPGGDKVVTIRGADGTVLRRILLTAQGEEYTLVDDTQDELDIEVAELPQIVSESESAGERGEAELRTALQAQHQHTNGRSFSLRQVREIGQVRALAPQIELDAVRFPTGSAAIQPEQARRLARVGNTLRDLIIHDPRTVILVEGHTDAVGDATYNLALSDRRAETVALALTEYFDVPPENMITQGYGEASLKVQTADAEPANRRAVVRNITSLLR